MISVLSGDLYSRSGVKPQPRQRTGTIKFQQSRAPMSQQNFGEIENNLRGGGVSLLLAGADRSGTMGGADMNLINSPISITFSMVESCRLTLTEKESKLDVLAKQNFLNPRLFSGRELAIVLL